MVEVAKETGIKEELIDRVYVADRGMIIPEKALFLPEEEKNGYALLQLLLHAIKLLHSRGSAQASGGLCELRFFCESQMEIRKMKIPQ